jgi:hypothetical protein
MEDELPMNNLYKVSPHGFVRPVLAEQTHAVNVSGLPAHCEGADAVGGSVSGQVDATWRRQRTGWGL